MRWISANAKQFSSKIILYPYSFNYIFESQNEKGDKISKLQQFRQGSFISLNFSEIEQYNIGLKTNWTFSTKKARAVFDSDFAILSIEYLIDNHNIEVFEYSSDWCLYFQSYYGKGMIIYSFKEFLDYKIKNPSKT